eukprot:6474061-Pyramimonas_sp.AAC.1
MGAEASGPLGWNNWMVPMSECLRSDSRSWTRKPNGWPARWLQYPPMPPQSAPLLSKNYKPQVEKK